MPIILSTQGTKLNNLNQQYIEVGLYLEHLWPNKARIERVRVDQVTKRVHVAGIHENVLVFFMCIQFRMKFSKCSTTIKTTTKSIKQH